MGTRSSSVRPLHPFSLYSPYHSPSPVPFQGPLSRETVEAGSSTLARHRSNRGRPQTVLGKGVLLPIFSHPKEVGRLETHSRPSKAEPVPSKAPFQDGNLINHHSVVEQKGLVCSPRFAGRLLPRRDSRGAQTFSSFPVRERALSVQGPAIWSSMCSESFHQDISGGRGPFTQAGGDNISLLRRLSPQGCNVYGNMSHGPDSIQRICSSGPPHKLKEVIVSSLPEPDVHRCATRFNCSASILTTRTFYGNQRAGTHRGACSNNSHTCLSAAVGTHGRRNHCSAQRKVTFSLPPALVSHGLHSVKALCPQASSGATVCPGFPPVVDQPDQSSHGRAISSTTTLNTNYYRCLPYRLGSSHGQPYGSGTLVDTRDATAYQCARIKSGTACLQIFPSPHSEYNDQDFNGQYGDYVLYQQTRGCPIPFSLRREHSSMELVYRQQHRSHSILPSRHRQFNSRLSQQTFSSRPRMGGTYGRTDSYLRSMGIPNNRFVRDRTQFEMSRLLLESRNRTPLSGRCLSPPLGHIATIRLSPGSVNSQGSGKGQHGRSPGDTPSTIMGSSALVLNAPPDVSESAICSASSSESVDPGQRSPQAPETRSSTPHRMDACWFTDFEQSCSRRVKEVLMHSRKESTRTAYAAKWSKFQAWCTDNSVDSRFATLPCILEYLLQLHDKGLALASLRVHLAAINAFHHRDGDFSLFAHPTTKRFLKGLSNLHPPRRPPPPLWNLDLVLQTLTRPPFEPLATVSLHLLTIKLVFLLAITSARRVSEIAAFMASPPYTVFSKESVTLRAHPAFIPKVSSDFHINEPVVLPCFFPKPHSSSQAAQLHTLDVRRSLAFYIDRTRDFRKTDRLLLSLARQSKGQPLTSQRISKLIVSCISMCHSLRGKPLPSLPKAHSTRTVATTTAFLSGVSFRDICRAATWSSNVTFMKHYAIVDQFASDVSVATAVLHRAGSLDSGAP
ncbi:uncharacterized protein LOC102454623 [Pelodiscus sinensis]|uniref:uncharacterized protein LOC102454623 n=1 Tax=Pelodiscus sinensis TaxID=13735 RepID=UPI003F6C35C3